MVKEQTQGKQDKMFKWFKRGDKQTASKSVSQAQWRIVWRQFRRHRLAMICLWILVIAYIVGVVMPGFFAPNGKLTEFKYGHLPPQSIHFFDKEGNFHLRPFVYERTMVTEDWVQKTKEIKDKRYPIKFFVRGTEYKLAGLFKTDIHLFGVEGNTTFFPLGTDKLGRCLFSRIIYASRISLTIGFIGVAISLVMGLIFGGISGFFGGFVDDIIQRLIELMMSIPKLPLWMALAAAVPAAWSSLQVYLAIVVLLSFLSWTGLARVVRSQFMSLREQDFVLAARGYNVSTGPIIFRHLVPNFMSYLLVNLTLTIPGMIIAETSLSFLGIGLKPPTVSLGVLLQNSQNFQNIALYPWILTPGIVIVVIVLAFNFVGDGLRDAADPYH